jgi:hypothetical protein
MCLRGHLEWQHRPIKFHEIPPIGSKGISEGRTDAHTHTDREAGDWYALFHFWKVG